MTTPEELRELNFKIAKLKDLKMEYAPNAGKSALCFIGLSGHEREDYRDWVASIEDAWELFEEMPEESTIGKEDEIWAVHFDDPNPSTVHGYCIAAETAPEAICRAWIKWKESK